MYLKGSRRRSVVEASEDKRTPVEIEASHRPVSLSKKYHGVCERVKSIKNCRAKGGNFNFYANHRAVRTKAANGPKLARNLSVFFFITVSFFI